MIAGTKYPNDKSGTLFDVMMQRLGIKNDAALARKLDVAAPVISKIRHGVLPFGSTLIIRVHELTEWPIRDIKAMLPPADKLAE